MERAATFLTVLHTTEPAPRLSPGVVGGPASAADVPNGDRMTTTSTRPPAPGRSRRSFRERVAGAIAADQDGVCSREQLRASGITRDDVRHEIAAGRWHSRGNQTVQIKPGGPDAERRRAIWEVRGQARLDGVTALQAAGLAGWTETTMHVSVPEGTRIAAVTGVTVHRIRPSIPTTGDPLRATPEWAALHGASWAASDRSASALLAMAVQQRLTTGERLAAITDVCPLLTRIVHIRAVLADISGGAQAISEIDFVTLCRSHSLPPPIGQAARQGHRGRIYLDASWPDYNVAVEVDGSQHFAGLAQVEDALRDNELRHDGMTVLRIPALGLRIETDAFVNQLRRALVRGGWHA